MRASRTCNPRPVPSGEVTAPPSARSRPPRTCPIGRGRGEAIILASRASGCWAPAGSLCGTCTAAPGPVWITDRLATSDRCGTFAAVADHVLLPSQQADVHRAVRAERFDPREFLRGTQPTEVTHFGLGRTPFDVPILVHSPSRWYFAFDYDRNADEHWAVFGPGRQSPEDRVRTVIWESQLTSVREWLIYLRREIETPDVWAEVGRERKLLSAPGPDDGNSQFSDEERRLIWERLTELKDMLAAGYGLQEGQLREVETRLKELERATARLGRFDWRQVMVAELVGLVVRAVIPQNAFHAAAAFVIRNIGHLIGLDGAPELPGLPPEMTA